MLDRDKPKDDTKTALVAKLNDAITMQTRYVEKIKGLSHGIQADDNYVTISFAGKKDKVRRAARDVIYGLQITQKACGQWRHTSELDKMINQNSFFDEKHAQIDIIIPSNEFDGLILMFRYCNQIGLEIDRNDLCTMYSGSSKDFKWRYINKNGREIAGISTLGYYLLKVKEIADENQARLEIKSFARPVNRNFWLQAELEEDAKKRNTNTRKYLDTLSLFSGSVTTLEIKKKSIQAKLDHIASLVEVMLESHPENYNNCSMKSMALIFLGNYNYMIKDMPNYDPDKLNFKREFGFIRNDHIEQFKMLANKHMRLMDQFNELCRPVNPPKRSCILV